MVSEHKRYLRTEKAKDDRQQSRFDAHGWLQPSVQAIREIRQTINPNEAVICPFCLYKATIATFFVMTNKGISQGKAQCPECKNGMLMKTLIEKRDAESYADFVFHYRQSGYWKKCPFETWKNRLVTMGWAGPFWTRYKELKGDSLIRESGENAEEQAEKYAEASGHYEEI